MRGCALCSPDAAVTMTAEPDVVMLLGSKSEAQYWSHRSYWF